jgi:serine/threonine protein kinase
MAPSNSEIYYNLTVVVHPLKNPEIPTRRHIEKDDKNTKNDKHNENERDDRDDQNGKNEEKSKKDKDKGKKAPPPSIRYLQARPGGFIFLKALKSDITVWVGLFAAVDVPQEFVIKKLKGIQDGLHQGAASRKQPMPPEIEICSIPDPLTRRQLPLNHSMPSFVQLHALQVHDLVTREDKWKDFKATLYYKYYNGGTLLNLIRRYKAARKQVPEGFIWHVIAQIGRALAYLHTGAEDSPVFNIMHRHKNKLINPASNEEQSDEEQSNEDQPNKLAKKPVNLGEKSLVNINKAQGIPGWEVISHMDGHADNIWLHSLSDEEKKRDSNLEGFTDALPQVVLGDFGIAVQAQHDRLDSLKRNAFPNVPEIETIRDKAYFATNLKYLICAADPDVRYSNLAQNNPEGFQEAARRRSQHVLSMELSRYSPQLQECMDKLESLVKLCETRFTALEHGQLPLEEFASNDFMYGTMLACADAKVHEYRNSEDEEQESVRWTQPSMSSMPFRMKPGHFSRGKSRHFAEVWRGVHEDLQERVVRNAFNDWESGSVEIYQAGIANGTPEKDSELEEVPWTTPQEGRPPQPTARHAPAREHGPDSLSSYVDSDAASNADAALARRAAVMHASEPEPRARLREGVMAPRKRAWLRHLEQLSREESVESSSAESDAEPEPEPELALAHRAVVVHESERQPRRGGGLSFFRERWLRHVRELCRKTGCKICE